MVGLLSTHHARLHTKFRIVSCARSAIASSRLALVTTLKTLRRRRLLKKPPGPTGDDPGGPPERHPPRAVVAGRGARGPEEQDRPPLGQTGNPAPRSARPANELGLHLWGDLPARG